MIFTIISILLGVFEYFLSSKFIYVSSSIIISFCVESKNVIHMSRRKFENKMVFRQKKVIDSMAKMLNVRVQQVEKLKPKLSQIGALYTFCIAADSNEYNNIDTAMHQVVDDGELIKVCFSV